MQGDDFDPYDFEPPIPDGYVLCPRCDGHQEVACHCGGDLCVCENYGEMPCPLCGGEYGGEGYVAKEKADAYLKRHAEIYDAFRAGLEGSSYPTEGDADA